MNELHVQRLTKDTRPTIGVVRVNSSLHPARCFSLEDRYREEKVKGDTRIPAGTYPLRWRKVGRWAQRFIKRWGVPGSLELCTVPNYTDVLIHIGNTKGDTEGCLLLGMGADLDTRTITKSAVACRHLYQLIARTGGEWQVRIDG